MTVLISGSTGSGNVTESASKIYETKTKQLDLIVDICGLENIYLRFTKSHLE